MELQDSASENKQDKAHSSEFQSKINGKEPLKREKLSEEQLSDLIAAVGNSEAKAITLAAMEPGTIYDQQGLYHRFLHVQGQNPGWKVNNRTPINYCRYSLAPIGLVAKEALRADASTFGYVKTEFGQEVGDALSGHFLDISARYPEASLSAILGQTASKSKERTAKKRLRIFRVLLEQSQPIRLTDMANLSELDTKLSDHLNNLNQEGIITYQTYEGDKPYVFYKATDKTDENRTPILGGYVKFSTRIWNIIKEHKEKWLSRKEIAELFLAKHKSRRQAGWKETTLEATISSVLNLLHERGFIVRQKSSLDSKTEISLSENQRAFISEIVVVCDAIGNLNENILSEGRKKAKEIINNPQKTAALAQKARESSRHFKQSPLNEIAGQILAIIKENPEIKENRIRQILEERYGKTYSSEGVKHSLRILRNTGQAIASKKTNANYWSAS